MYATVGRARRIFAKTALAAIALSVVVPLGARAANESCGTSVAMTDVGTSPVTHPGAGVARGTVAKTTSAWYTGVFHDIALESASLLSLHVYKYTNKPTDCTSPNELCHADASGPSSPARCQFNTESARYYVEVRNAGDTPVDFQLLSAYHCYVKDPLQNCVVVTP